LATSLEIEPLQPANRTENSGKLIRNTILQAIPDSEYSLLRSHLQTVRLEHEQVLFQPNQPIEYCYFPNSGMVSMVVVTSDGSSVEVGVVGFEGFVGPSVLRPVRSRRSSRSPRRKQFASRRR
jgi:hypothetical protein